MNHQDHVRLIEKGITEPGGVWADFGSGEGAFTLALRDAAGPAVTIYSIDQDASRLVVQRAMMEKNFPGTDIHYLNTDFREPVHLPALDGIIMANSLHYVSDQVDFMKSLHAYLKPHGTLLIVEYNTKQGNVWVPYPVSYEKFVLLTTYTGFESPQLLTTVPSSFLHEIYSSATHN